MRDAPLNLLCVEPTFPGRLGALADWLVRKRGYRCWFAFNTAASREHWPSSTGQGLELVPFNVGGVAREVSVPWTRHFERSLCFAYGAWEVIDARRIRPIDLIIGRSAGLGSSLFLPISYPGIPTLQRMDYFIHPRRHDLADDDAAQLPDEYVMWRQSANAMELLELENGVVPYTSSHWQRELFPQEYQSMFNVFSESIPARQWSPRGGHPTSIAGRIVPENARVVSFIESVPDRLRGFDRFAELSRGLLSASDNVICIAVGGGAVGRMLDVKYFGQDYAAQLLEERPMPSPERFWRLGNVSPEVVATVLRRTNLHIYASRPYPIARSLLQALASGAVVLAWDTPPIRDVIQHGETGLLVPDDSEAALTQALAVLDRPSEFESLGQRATELVRDLFDHDVVFPQVVRLLEDLVSNTRVASAVAH